MLHLGFRVCGTGCKQRSRIFSNDVLFLCGVQGPRTCDVPGNQTRHEILDQFLTFGDTYVLSALNVYCRQVEIFNPLETDAFESTIVTGCPMVCCSMNYLSTKPRHHLLFDNAKLCTDLIQIQSNPWGLELQLLQICAAYSETTCSSQR